MNLKGDIPFCKSSNFQTFVWQTSVLNVSTFECIVWGRFQFVSLPKKIYMCFLVMIFVYKSGEFLNTRCKQWRQQSSPFVKCWSYNVRSDWSSRSGQAIYTVMTYHYIFFVAALFYKRNRKRPLLVYIAWCKHPRKFGRIRKYLVHKLSNAQTVSRVCFRLCNTLAIFYFLNIARDKLVPASESWQ